MLLFSTSELEGSEAYRIQYHESVERLVSIKYQYLATVQYIYLVMKPWEMWDVMKLVIGWPVLETLDWREFVLSAAPLWVSKPWSQTTNSFSLKLVN